MAKFNYLSVQKQMIRFHGSSSLLLIPPTPLGEGGTIYSNGFFVQTILADRYIHRREM